MSRNETPMARDLDKRQVRLAFERAAPGYDRAAVLQHEVGARLVARLDLIKPVPGRILDVGCGTGRLGAALARRYRRAEVVGLDLALNMARQARRQAGWFTRRRFLCGDAERLPLAGASVDMVISNLTLQWCQPDAAFAEFARVLRPGGLLTFTSFGPDTLKELRAAWRTVDDAPHVHGFIDMHDLGDALVRAGFADPVMDVEYFRLTYPDVPALLHDLKHIGAHNAAHTRPRGLTGRRAFARFQQAYAAQAEDGRIPATYEVVYGHAWAPEPSARARTEGAVAIPLSWIGRRR